MNMKDTYSKLFFRRIMGSSPIESALTAFLAKLAYAIVLKTIF